MYLKRSKRAALVVASFPAWERGYVGGCLHLNIAPITICAPQELTHAHTARGSFLF